MKTLNIYNAYLDDGHDTYKIVVPAESKKDAAAYVSGNGEIIAIKEDTDLSIHTERLASDLRRLGWGEQEIDVIVRTLCRTRLDFESRRMVGKAWSPFSE